MSDKRKHSKFITIYKYKIHDYITIKIINLN